MVEVISTYFLKMLEIVYIVMCMFQLYGKKFRLNSKKLILIVLNLFLLQLHSKVPFIHVFIYLAFVLYCIVEFGFEKKKLITNVALCLVIISTVQMGVFFIWNVIYTYIWNTNFNQIRELILENQLIFDNELLYNPVIILIVWFLFPHLKLHRLSNFLQQKGLVFRLILSVSFFYVLYLLIQFRITQVLLAQQYIVILISLLLIGIVVFMWQKSQYKLREQELQLQMHQMYDEGFENLVTEIRRRQHDFQNHLNAIYSMHYTCVNYEELVKQQGAYVEAIQQENKYNKLLSIGNPVIIGFLYGKFLHAEKHNITVNYNIQIGELQGRMPIHKMVEVIGNLLDNAIEAIDANEKEKVIYLDFKENQEKIEFKIKNESDYVSQEERIKMFEKGQSSKGEHRGFGLANVKQICEQYKCDLQVQNRKENEKVYLEFQITLESEKVNKKGKKQRK